MGSGQPLAFYFSLLSLSLFINEERWLLMSSWTTIAAPRTYVQCLETISEADSFSLLGDESSAAAKGSSKGFLSEQGSKGSF